MKLASFEAVTGALHDAGVRYLIAGGLAVNAHGYQRLTVDIDLVIQLEPENILNAFRALATLGYTPTVPVIAEAFSIETQRQQWITEKGMKVLNFYSNQHPLTSVDVFVTEPFDFDGEYESALTGEVAPGKSVHFVSIPTLIAMKIEAGRPRDLDDIQHLRWIMEETLKNDKDRR